MAVFLRSMGRAHKKKLNPKSKNEILTWRSQNQNEELERA